MTHDRIENALIGGRGVFVSGVVLGLGLGFAAGHLLLFARINRGPESLPQAGGFPPFDPVAISSARGTEPPGTTDVDFSVLEIDDNPGVGRVKLSDESPDEELHYFPEAMNRPGGAVRAEYGLAFAAPANRIRHAAELTSQDRPAPNAIEPPLSATPIDERTSQREEMAHMIIAEELPDATTQEREIWYDALRGLPPEDIRGILRMRKRLGAKSTSSAGVLSDEPPIEAFPPSFSVSDRRQPDRGQIAEQLAAIDRHNLENRDTVAFKKIVPILTEAPEQAGVQLVSTVRDMTPGEIQSTGRPFDIAIDGPGFLSVRCGERVRYTRDGRLTTDSDGHLKLLATLGEWRLDPPVTIPHDATEIVIESDGRVIATSRDAGESPVGTIRVVHFFRSDTLRTDGEGLYEATDATGAPLTVPPGQASASKVRQRHVEASNVDADAIWTGTQERGASLRLFQND